MQELFDEEELKDMESGLWGLWLEEIYALDQRQKARFETERQQRQREADLNAKPPRVSRADAEQLFRQYCRVRVPVTVVQSKRR